MQADPGRHAGAREALDATLAYALCAMVLTWPLVFRLSRDVPSDFGDPLLNCWILAWDAEHLLGALGGQMGALGGYWNANIYYPHPLALAYSDHLTAQALQILPVYALTKDPLLCYNLLFLSTFVLSGLGMFLFARDLTGSPAAAFLAGLAYGFAPYRMGSIPHLQVLSSAWMPFALLGFRRFFHTRRVAPLAGAAVAWTVQNLSCSYYLIFFTPVLALYVAWEMTTRRLWRDRHTLSRVLAAGAAVVLATTPFVLPYVRLRQLGFAPRSLEETEHFAADVYGYLTADPNLWLWGSLLRGSPKAEGALFPGVTILTLAAMGILAAWRAARIVRDAAGPTPDRFGPAVRIVTAALVVSSGTLVALLLGWSLRLPLLKITSFDRVFLLIAALSAALLVLSARARQTARRWTASPVAILTLLTLFAVVMSFGPRIYSRERLIEDQNLYALFYRFVPGFDGLRVPARFAMIVALGLAALAAYGAAAIGRGRRGVMVITVACALIILESIAVPMPMNGNATDFRQPALAPLPDVVAVESIPPVYRFVAELPASAALVELPLGGVGYELRYMFYSTSHWRPLVNGYSGSAPEAYGLLSERLKDLAGRPEAAWTALAGSGATHAIVHEGAYTDLRGIGISRWLRGNGAREIASFGQDRVFELPRRSS